MKKYKIKIIPQAKREWNRLDSETKEQFKKQLKKRQNNPYIEKDKLKRYKDVYKIKLKSKAYRLAYKIIRDKFEIIILIIAKRDDIYKNIEKRTNR